MLTLLIFLLVSNALTTRRDKSTLFSRIVIKNFFLASFTTYNNIHVKTLENGIGIYGGLFNVTTITQSFNIFMLLILLLHNHNNIFLNKLCLLNFIPEEWFDIVSLNLHEHLLICH